MRTHNLINSWKSPNKQSDKLIINFRIATLTIFELSIDISRRSFRIMLLNFGYETSKI